jgi:hypothetical protein
MKKLPIILFSFLLPAMAGAQNTLYGLWSGELLNDSTHKKQYFEMGLSEYRGKITGFSYTTFIENDTFYYSIKKVKAEKRDGKLWVEDDGMVGNNFPARVSKGVHQTTVFSLVTDTTIDFINGRWSTNQTKKYYSIGGTAALKEEPDEKNSDLLAHLDELQVKNNIAAKTPEKKNDQSIVKVSSVVTTGGNKETNSPVNSNNSVAKNNPGTTNQPKQNITAIAPSKENSKPTDLVKPDNKIITDQNLNNTSSPLTKKDDPVPKPANQNTSTIAAVPEPKNNLPVNPNRAINNNISKSQPINNPVAITNLQKNAIDPSNSNEKAKPVVATTAPGKKTTVEETKALPQNVMQRKTESIQDIYFTSDSLVLSLYDNGIVDGDTVSVYLNGTEIISKQKLKESATKKTVYITPDMNDQVELILFAENLGTIPPNTGLLTIRDGENLYQVRFSADLGKNASIVLKRKKQ